MKLKLFHVLLVALPAYGIIISSISAFHYQEGSLLIFFNLGVQSFTFPLIFPLFFGFGTHPEPLSQILFGIVIVISNLMFWVPVAFLIPILRFKRKFCLKCQKRYPANHSNCPYCGE